MLFSEEFEKARKAAYKYLSYRSRTEYEMKQKLFLKGFDENIVSKVISSLLEYRMLNDQAYAQDYVDKRQLRPRAVLAGELKNLGVKESLVDEALSNIDPEAELRIALALAIGKKKRRGNDYPLVNIASFLRRRGFSQEVVDRVCDYLENMRQP